MALDNPGRIRTEDQLLGLGIGFSAAYMAVRYLASCIESRPDEFTDRTVDALICLIRTDKFDHKKQVLFLFQETAATLVFMACQHGNPISATIVPRLVPLLATATAKRLRGLGQAMARLPVNLATPGVSLDTENRSETISLEGLVDRMGICPPLEFSWQGRSLLVRGRGSTIGVMKFARSAANAPDLAREAFWMNYLTAHPPCPDTAFHIPCPVKAASGWLFSVATPLPGSPGAGPVRFKATEPDQGCLAIAFTTRATYFHYPNDPGELPGPGKQILAQPGIRLKEVFFRNARLLGALTAAGIYHTALIPLFHNRVQQGRRNDNGAYLWEHGGRLDQWLDSCRYPNFAVSGLRDFEHLTPARDSRQLGHYIGEHLLSFVLVIGSCFRNRAPGLKGKNRQTQAPCDTRHLFEKELFQDLVSGVLAHYFHGLTKTWPPNSLPVSRLVDDLVEVMGKDENMEEMLRIRDQEEMSDEAFATFLAERGIQDGRAKGEADIILMTGPHLGGFNQPISVPGLIDVLFRFSALCISHCFLSTQAAALQGQPT